MRLITFIDTTEADARSLRALALAESAARRGHEVMLMGLHHDAAPPGLTPLGALADERGILFRLLQKRSPLDPGLIGQISAAFIRFRPDVFVSHDLTGMALYRLPRTRPRHWFALRNPDASSAEAERTRPRIIRRFEVSTLNRAGGVLVMSDEEAEELVARGVKESLIRRVSAQGDDDLADSMLEIIEAGADA